MRTTVVIDPAVKAMPEYHAEDVRGTLKDAGLRSMRCSLGELAGLRREDTDLVIVPCVQGSFSAAALQSLVRFHEQGGSLFFLGDLPTTGCWYPLRNSHAARFHMTRCNDDFTPLEVGGSWLTDGGQRIVGVLPGGDFLRGKSWPCLRFTPFPEDHSTPIFREAQAQWGPSSNAVIGVDRRGPRFLGARLAVIGFIGGEPRENADGAWQKTWRHDPGLLDREWPGIHAVVRGLAAWLQPLSFAGAIDLRGVTGPQEMQAPEIVIRNMTKAPLRLDDVTLSADHRPAFRRARVSLAPGEVLRMRSALAAQEPGPHAWQLTAVHGGGMHVLDERTQGVLPPDSSPQPGYGFSTYWSFQEPAVTPEFGAFCRQMAQRGCQYVRANLPWEDVEPRPGEYEWRAADQLLEAAAAEHIRLQLWMFPTTRGSGLSDGGIPRWILREPAVDRTGNPGFFPSLWSPYYREHYFGMVDQLTRRYADAPALASFVLDFGNSDFPYGYNYYYNDPSLFDYSPWEQEAFSRYLREVVGLSLPGAGQLYGQGFAAWSEVPVPFKEQPLPYAEYLAFRTWSIRAGIEEVWRICRKNAPTKVPTDLPGHGMGSIQDLHAATLESKARHWKEEQSVDARLTALHNAGPTWGGEPWQVAGGYPQYDAHLFSSVRYSAYYFSIPGPDLGVNGEDITRVGLIRRTIMGATRPVPGIAVLDDLGAPDSLCQVAVRLDQEVDLLTAQHRYDLSCYRLLALPSQDRPGRTATGGGAGFLMPRDDDWYVRLRSSVERGLEVLVFPDADSRLRRHLGIHDLTYGPRAEMAVDFPVTFGGGSATGVARSVRGAGDVLLSASDGSPLLVRRTLGRGGVILAGSDGAADSLDRCADPMTSDTLAAHSFARLCLHLGLGPSTLRTGQANLRKSLLRRGEVEYLVVLNDRSTDVSVKIDFVCASGTTDALDLYSGEVLALQRSTAEGGIAESGGIGRGTTARTLSVTIAGGHARYLALRRSLGKEEK